MSLSEDSWQKIDAVFDLLSERFPDEESRVEITDGIVYFHVGTNSIGVEVRAIEQGNKKTLLQVVAEWRTAKWADGTTRALDEVEASPPMLMSPGRAEDPFKAYASHYGMSPLIGPEAYPPHLRPSPTARRPQILPEQHETRIWRDQNDRLVPSPKQAADQIAAALKSLREQVEVREAERKRRQELVEKSIPSEPVPEEKSEGPSDRTIGDASKVDGRVAEGADISPRSFDGVRVNIRVPQLSTESMALARAAMKKYIEPKPEEE